MMKVMDGTQKFPPVYCISLARAEERRAAMRRRLDLLGAPYEIVDAVDGRELDLAKLAGEGRLRQDLARRRKGRELTRGEIGCYLSHYNLWQKIAAENIATALVLEDDADWDADMAAAARFLQNIKCEWHVILLSPNEKHDIDGVVCEVPQTKYRLVRYKQRALTTAGYLINLAGAKILLEYCREIKEPVDVAYSAYWRNGAAFYSICPAAVRQVEEESSIGKFARDKNIFVRMRASVWRNCDRMKMRAYRRAHPVKTTGENA